MSPHAALEIVDGRWRCARCDTDLGNARENYKLGALKIVEPLADVALVPLPSGDFIGELHEYVCPGCATLLQVDVYCPMLGGETVLHDIEPALT